MSAIQYLNGYWVAPFLLPENEVKAWKIQKPGFDTVMGLTFKARRTYCQKLIRMNGFMQVITGQG
jgi:hypothetical protein